MELDITRDSKGRFASPLTRGAGGLFPSDKGGYKSAAPSASYGFTVERNPMGQGAYTSLFNGVVPRMVNPEFYETLRETIPIIDRAIHALQILDGTVEIECETDAQAREARAWAQSVRVNQIMTGFQTALRQLRGEAYEQGFGVMEFVADAPARDITDIYIADSKKIWFTRADAGKLEIYFQPDLRTRRWIGAPLDYAGRVLSPTWPGSSTLVGFDKARASLLNTGSISIIHHNPENQDPHGVSILRSIPFVAKMLMTINNAVLNTWERFGDPSYVAVYKGKPGAAPGSKPEDITRGLASDLKRVVESKRAGRSADLARFIGKDDDLTIKVLGADGQVLQLEAPMKFVIEQTVSGLGISMTLAGIPAPGVDETVAVDSALFASRVRFREHAPELAKPIIAALRLRGVAVKPGDVNLKQEQPSYDDILKKAQASFMYAQARAIYGVEFADGPAMIDATSPAPASPSAPPPSKASTRVGLKRAGGRGAIDPTPVIEKAVNSINSAWLALGSSIAQVLNLPLSKGERPEGPRGFNSLSGAKSLSSDEKKKLTTLAEDFLDELNGKGGYVDASIESVYTIGQQNAASVTGLAKPLLVAAARERAVEAVRALTFAEVKNKTFTILKDEIIAGLEKATVEGSNPQDVAHWLEQIFDGKQSDWARLARTELASAHNTAKVDEWETEGVQALTSVIGDVNCAICGPTAGVYPLDSAPSYPRDTHPNCTCTNRPSTRAEIETAGLSLPDNINPNADLLMES